MKVLIKDFFFKISSSLNHNPEEEKMSHEKKLSFEKSYLVRKSSLLRKSYLTRRIYLHSKKKIIERTSYLVRKNCLVIKVREVKIVKEVRRSDGLCLFACGNVSPSKVHSDKSVHNHPLQQKKPQDGT